MTKILIAQIYAGGLHGSLEEKKASFTLEDVEKDRAQCEGEFNQLHWIFYGEWVGPSRQLGGKHIDGPCSHMFEPNWDGINGDGSLEEVLKKVLAGNIVLIEGEETVHALVLDYGDSTRKELLSKLRNLWMRNETADEDGWD